MIIDRIYRYLISQVTFCHLFFDLMLQFPSCLTYFYPFFIWISLKEIIQHCISYSVTIVLIFIWMPQMRFFGFLPHFVLGIKGRCATKCLHFSVFGFRVSFLMQLTLYHGFTDFILFLSLGGYTSWHAYFRFNRRLGIRCSGYRTHGVSTVALYHTYLWGFM